MSMIPPQRVFQCKLKQFNSRRKRAKATMTDVLTRINHCVPAFESVICSGCEKIKPNWVPSLVPSPPELSAGDIVGSRWILN
jgi:hypothetical protein